MPNNSAFNIDDSTMSNPFIPLVVNCHCNVVVAVWIHSVANRHFHTMLGGKWMICCNHGPFDILVHTGTG